MRNTLRSLIIGAAAAALLSVAAPAGAQTGTHFEDNRVTASPGCAGLVHTEVSVSPLPSGDRAVAVALMFTADRQDPACAVTSTVSWRNIDSGATGSEDLTVSSVPHPGGRFETDHGYGRVLADTGPGAVVVTTTTNPGEVAVTVS